MPNSGKVIYHYLPTTGVRADLKRLMNEFISAQTVRYEQFSQIWRKRRFSFLCAGRYSDRETREFLERVLLIAVEFFLPPYQFQVRVGGLYLLYGIFMTQPISPKTKVRLTVSQWEDTIQLQQEANEQNHLDVVYVFNKMLEEHAFQFCYTPTEMNERTLNPEREDNEINLADDMKVEQREIDHLFNYESMEQLSYLLKHYHQMKVGMAGRKSAKPDKSLDVVQGSMVEDLVVMLQSFKESCSNIYKHGTAHAAASEEAGTSGTVKTILSKRQAIKSKIYGEVEADSPVIKTDPESPGPQTSTNDPEMAQSSWKNSSIKFVDSDEEQDNFEPYVSTNKRGRGHPRRKLKSSMSSPHQNGSTVKNMDNDDSKRGVKRSYSPPLRTKRKGRKGGAKSISSVDTIQLNGRKTPDVRGFDTTILPSSLNRLSGKQPHEFSSSLSHDNFDNPQTTNCGTQIDVEDVEYNTTPSKNRSKLLKSKKIITESDNSSRERKSTRKRKQLQKFSPDQRSPEISRTQSRNSVLVVDSDDDDFISSEDGILSNIRQGKLPANRKRMALNKKNKPNVDSPHDEENKKIGRMRMSRGQSKNGSSHIEGKKKSPELHYIDEDLKGETDEPPIKKAKSGKGNALINGSSSSSNSIEKSGDDTELSFLEGNRQVRSKIRGLSEKRNNISRNDSSKLQSSPKGTGEGILKPMGQGEESESTDRLFVEKISKKAESVKSGKNATSYDRHTKSGAQRNVSGKSRGRPRKEGVVRAGAPKSSIKRNGSVNEAEHSARDSTKEVKDKPSSKNFRLEQKSNLKNSAQSTVISPTFAGFGSGGKHGKSKVVSVVKTPLSNILSGSGSSKGQVAGSVKVIKIVAKSKAEAQEVLKSIEKQRASGDKLLSNLPSNCVQTISVGTRLLTNKAVKKVGTSVTTKESKTSNGSEIPSSSSATGACNKEPKSRKKTSQKLVYVSV